MSSSPRPGPPVGLPPLPRCGLHSLPTDVGFRFVLGKACGLPCTLRPPPAAVTWVSLVGSATISDLVNHLPAASTEANPSITYWNLRWLCDPFTAIATSKKSVLTEALKRRRIVTIVETHWDAATVARWEGTFATATVCAAPARPAPPPGLGGPQGGTAIILPPGATCHSFTILVPGCAQVALISLLPGSPQL